MPGLHHYRIGYRHRVRFIDRLKQFWDRVLSQPFSERSGNQLAIDDAIPGLAASIQHKHPFVGKITPERRAHILAGIGPVGIYVRVQMAVGLTPPGIVFDVRGKRLYPVMDRLIQQHRALPVGILINIPHDDQQCDNGNNKQRGQERDHQ